MKSINKRVALLEKERCDIVAEIEELKLRRSETEEQVKLLRELCEKKERLSGIKSSLASLKSELTTL